MTPLIGITCGLLAPGFPGFGVRPTYVRALRAAGAEAVLVPPGAAAQLLGRLDGLLLPGGPDLHPRHYGEPIEGSAEIDEERDQLELAMVNAAVEGDLPVLGICRGQQVINVALGGSLRQHVDGHAWEGRPRSRLAHGIRIEAGSRLRELAGSARAMVNSGHHQVVGRSAAGLRVSALSEPDGLIEGLESRAGRLLAVQCHPEELVGSEPWAAALFADFVARCAAGGPQASERRASSSRSRAAL